MLDPASSSGFLPLATRVLPWLAGVTALAFAVGLIKAFNAPDDFQQGATVLLMFLHVPAAWLITLIWGVMSIAAVVTLVWRHPLADVAAKTAAPLGAVFTALALVTGSLWGKPMWGAYWVWDARLTSFLLLLFLYLGYIALWNAIEDETRAARAAAILALVGVVNLPIIEFSVDWWNTLHQGESIIRSGGPLISAVFLWPLGLMAVGYTTLFFTLWMIRIRTEIINRRARALQLESV